MFPSIPRTPLALTLGLALGTAGCGRASDVEVTGEAAQGAVETTADLAGEAPAAPAGAPSCEVGVPGLASEPQLTVDPTTVVLTVNGRALTQADYDDMVLRLIRRREPLEPEAMARLRENHRARVERKLILDVLLSAEVAKEGLEPTPEELETYLREKEKELPSGTTIDSALASAGIERAEWEGYQRKRLAWKKLREKKSAGRQVSDAEARAYFDEHVADYQREESVRTRHILVRVSRGATKEERREKRAKIDDVRARLVRSKGADFEEIAKEVSECPTGKQGGQLGDLTRGKTLPPFEKAAFSLAVGEISPVVETRYGYHVLQVQARMAAGPIPYDEVAESIKKRLEHAARKQALEDYMQALEKSAVVVRPGEQTGAKGAVQAERER